MAHKTVGISLPDDIIAKLPALMSKYNVNTTSMVIRKVLQEAIDFHLPESPKGAPKGDTIVVTSTPKGGRDFAAEVEARGVNDPERPRRCPDCGGRVEWRDEEGSCTNDSCKSYNPQFFTV